MPLSRELRNCSDNGQMTINSRSNDIAQFDINNYY